MTKLKCLIVFATVCLALGVAPSAFANSTEILLQNAREKKAQGDLSGAAALYQEILKQENHQAARQELAEVLIDAQIKDPDSEAYEMIKR